MCVGIAPDVEARGNYLNLIPSGSGNARGCDVCHNSADAGGRRNPFGEAFGDTTAGRGGRWTTALAMMDSDGDGASNGEELGDPMGRWSQGDAPTTYVSNPGSNCGDDVATGTEDCDGADLRGTECFNVGDFNAGRVTCKNDCSFDISMCVKNPVCGNFVIEQGEACDTDQLDGKTCADAGDFIGGDLACAPDCTLDTSSCQAPAMCGDDVREGDEACDGTDLTGASCSGAGDFIGGAISCADDCTLDTSLCVARPGANCGNGVIDDDEACDGVELGGKTCADAGDFDAGALVCASDCSLNTTACTKTDGMAGDMGSDMGTADMSATSDMEGSPETPPTQTTDDGCAHVPGGGSAPGGALPWIALLGWFGWRRRRAGRA